MTPQSAPLRVCCPRRRRAVGPVLLCLVLAATAGACGDGGGDGRADRVRPDGTTIEVPSPLPTTAAPTATPSGPATPGPGATSGRPRTTTPTASGAGPRPGPSGAAPGGPRTTGPRPPTTAPRPATRPAAPTTGALTRALLSTAQLPAGYTKTILKNDPPTRSSRPDCVQRLNALEIHRTTVPGSVEARVAFAQSSSGPFLQQVLRWYPGARTARRQLDAAAGALAGCGTYTLTWPDGDQARQTVTPHGSAGVGTASWHATVSVTYEAVTVRETLVLVVVRDSLVILSHLGSPQAPSRAQTLSLAAKAAARVP
ncbi:hypothetical protein [Streptomyces sp. NPDC048057]|uniref:hypothetical protein n=1 Tax=Streptomyces sp. NPDC048057 TaxID=3155628 RepID=UPI0033EAA95F